MSQFLKNLEALAVIDDLASLELYEGNKVTPVAIIENKPGKAGSLRVYYYLANQFGGISPKAAEIGLEIFAEYTEQAKQNPGSHPNIDLLFDVIQQQRYIAVKAIKK